MRQQRYPRIEENLTLTKDPQRYLFFHSETEPTVELSIKPGFVFEFNQLLEYKREGDETARKTSETTAQLQVEGDFAIFVFLGRERIRLEDVLVNRELRAEVISYE
jgi:hypothetical protein